MMIAVGMLLEQAVWTRCDSPTPTTTRHPIGDGGMQLSGGQRQRLAIAQALLTGARQLLLDEATSALDSIAEQEVQQALDQAMRDRSTPIIAHRLSTIVNADAIAVIDGGQIIEHGRHEELLANGGMYSRLFQAQSMTVSSMIKAGNKE